MGLLSLSRWPFVSPGPDPLHWVALIVADDAQSSAIPRDEDLVARLRDGDEAAFRDIVRGMHRALSRVALAFVGDAAAAEEVVQETWVAVVAQIDRFEQRSSLRTWIGSILANRAKTRAVRDKRSIPFSSLSTEDGEPVEPERFGALGTWSAPPRRWDSGPESLALRKEAREAIERELARLPESQRTVVVLRDLEGWSSEEVCNVLGVSETNQRVLLHRGRMKLRAALERYHSGDGP
jgi:RNA polymerase sigma-70 factor (ECF subfamily)